MAELSLEERSPLEGLAVPGRYGTRAAMPGVILCERTGLALASVITRQGKAEAVSKTAHAIFGVDLPTTPRYVDGSRIAFLWTGPDRWLAVAPRQTHDDIDQVLRDAFGTLASVSLQSDAWCVLRIAGPKVRDVLATGLSIDLHPRSFGPNDTAVTQAAHIGLQIWQLDTTPTYELAVFRGFAQSLWKWLVDAAAPHGYQVTAPLLD